MLKQSQIEVIRELQDENNCLKRALLQAITEIRTITRATGSDSLHALDYELPPNTASTGKAIETLARALQVLSEVVSPLQTQ